MSARDWLPARIRTLAVARMIAAGENLFRQGDRTFGIFEIEAGRIQLMRHDRDGHRLILYTAGPGDLLAEAGLFSAHYHCDAIAVVDSSVYVYPKAALLSTLHADPAFAEKFMAILARQVQSLRTRLEQRNVRSARERVMQHLALVAGPHGHTVQLAGTLKDLAAELGLTHEALYRTLARLETEGRIERDGRTIHLRSRPSI